MLNRPNRVIDLDGDGLVEPPKPKHPPQPVLPPTPVTQHKAGCLPDERIQKLMLAQQMGAVSAKTVFQALGIDATNARPAARAEQQGHTQVLPPPSAGGYNPFR